MADFDAALFWPEFKAAGMLVTATDDDGDFDVGYAAPGMLMLDGTTRSTEHVIEYQATDRPVLAEGAELTIDGVQFRVRERPQNTPSGATFWQIALLTKL